MSSRLWNWVLLAAGILMVSLAGSGSAADPKGQLLPDDDYPKMVKYAVKSIQDALKGTPDDVKATKARTAAIMLAAYAQQNLGGADGQQRATVRDAALKLADTIEKKKYADASKQAGAIATVAADPNAKKEKVAIEKQIPVRDLMNQFNHPPDGGYGIDRQFYAYRLGMKQKIPTDELKESLLVMAYQVAITAEMVNSKTPKSKEKEWDNHSSEVMKGAVMLAEAVKM